MSDRYSPFSNGSEWMDWQDNNCCRCAKIDWSDPENPKGDCEITNALADAQWGDGTVSPEIGRRLGCDRNPACAWDCPERDTVEEKP